MMIKVLQFALIALFLTSCSLFRPVAKTSSPVRSGPFMEDVSITIQPAVASINMPTSTRTALVETARSNPEGSSDAIRDIEQYIPAAFRFSLLLDIEVEALINRSLFQYISQWWATPYRIGGNDLNGVDCSGFIKGLCQEAFERQLPRTSKEQSDVCTPINKEDLKEGDLVFFKTGRGAVSHVGMYLANNKFVHASTSVGVTISDLDEPYWKNRLVKMGRIPSL